MKKIIIILFFIYSQSIFSQVHLDTLTSEDKNWILSNLGSDENAYTAIIGVIKYHIPEAEDSIIYYIWKNSRVVQTKFVKALQVIGSSYAHTYAIALLDSINNNPSHGESWSFPDDDKVSITEVLFDLGDYSTATYVFELLEKYKPEVNNLNAIKLLPRIIKNVPEYEQEAKSQLIYASLHSIDPKDRIFTLKKLYDIYGDQIKPYIEQMFISDSSVDNRGTVLLNYLYRYNDLDDLYRERLLQEEDATLRLEIIKELIGKYGRPSDFLFVKEYLKNENDSTVISLGEYYINVIQLPNNDSLNTIQTSLDSLSSIINQIFSYNWINDLTFVNKLHSYVQTAISKIQSEDSLGCRLSINSFQDSVDYVYADSLNPDPRFVTLEGWKFLHWNAQYILDRLPANKR
jgi:hypothetical protein